MNQQMIINHCEEASRRVRERILTMAYRTGKSGSHLGGSLSLVELLTCLYVGRISLDPDNPNWENRDRVILSKGHGAMALYASMVEAGIISEDLLLTFKTDGSLLGAHPSLNGLPGIEFASGSLGQGLSMGVGVALALQRKKNSLSRVYVILGDGECDEGSVWEAAASAAHFNCDQITAIIDVNSLQYDGFTCEIMNMTPLHEKWKAFGWDVLSINGHNIPEIMTALQYESERPVAIIAHTTKGKGVSFMENDWRWHNASLSKEQYERAITEVSGGCSDGV